MEPTPGKIKRKWSLKKKLLWIAAVLFVIAAIIFLYVSNNFNRLLSEALIKNFNSGIISDVYELKFEKLQVNLLAGDIEVHNVTLQPREKPLHSYPYINSSLQFSTEKILLKNVEISTLLKSNMLRLEKIEIRRPNVEIKVNGSKAVLFPFKDTSVAASPVNQNKKKFVESFFLKQYQLEDASFHVINSVKQREFSIQKLNITLNDLMLNQHVDENLLSYKNVELSIGEMKGHMKKGGIKYIDLKDYKVAVDSLNIRDTPDTTVYRFADFSTGLKALDIQTADSIFHLTVESLDVSYKDKSIKLGNISFKPNISEAAMQKRFQYQNTQLEGTVGKMDLSGVNFDSLIHEGKLFIDKIALDKVSVSLFKDQGKPLDKSRFPGYPGQQIKGISTPLLIKQLQATNVNLVNRERKPDGSYGRANVNRLTLDARNITNLTSQEMLTVHADGYIENKAHAQISLGFSYSEQQFSINGELKKFNLPDLNPLLRSYTPASIRKGTADVISFSGNVYRTNASGTMKFLYHDLEVDLQLKEKATWKDDVLAFGANTLLTSSNPASENVPPRIVQFHVTRDMNKGFVNILIKSLLNGVKETMIMSKENKKAYREAKKKAKKDRKNRDQ